MTPPVGRRVNTRPSPFDDDGMSDIGRLRRELIFVEDARAVGVDPRELQRACRKGVMTRVRRGVYIPTSLWRELDGRDQHLLAIVAVTHRCQPPFLVAGASAGAVWGLPYAAAWPAEVTLLIPAATGGKSERGVRRTVVSAEGAVGVAIDGIPVTTFARTALDMARTEDFPMAVAILDRAMWRRDANAATIDELYRELGRAGFVRRGGHLVRALSFASELSDSPYESLTRATIHELGFVAPLLQVELRDREGIITPDFLWPGIAAAEFDGRVKYTRDEFTGGDPSGVVWREKKREDRLRRLVPTVVRIVADDVHDRGRLARLLDEANVPRIERPLRGTNAPGGTGALAPKREQWPQWGET
jgi:predicted transcriptional regulator of viral defense system